MYRVFKLDFMSLVASVSKAGRGWSWFGFWLYEFNDGSDDRLLKGTYHIFATT